MGRLMQLNVSAHCLQVLARIFMVRSDVGYTVRTAAVHVWKTVVTNTPRTTGEILTTLMDQIIESLGHYSEFSCRSCSGQPSDGTSVFAKRQLRLLGKRRAAASAALSSVLSSVLLPHFMCPVLPSRSRAGCCFQPCHWAV